MHTCVNDLSRINTHSLTLTNANNLKSCINVTFRKPKNKGPFSRRAGEIYNTITYLIIYQRGGKSAYYIRLLTLTIRIRSCDHLCYMTEAATYELFNFNNIVKAQMTMSCSRACLQLSFSAKPIISQDKNDCFPI